MTDTQPQPRPTCDVRGLLRPGAMCGAVIVGGTYCGYAGECPHKVDARRVAREAAAEITDAQIRDQDGLFGCVEEPRK